jgi:hypothetical protein
MVVFLNLIGIVQILGGILVFAQSASAIHEILGAISFGMGALSLGLAALLGRLSDMRDIAKGQLEFFEARMSRKTEAGQQ